MASARILSATELGANRYDQALKSSKWPIEVRLPNAFLTDDLSPSVYSLVLKNTKHEQHIPFNLSSSGDLYASTQVLQGLIQYEIHRSDKQNTLVSTGGLDVTPPNSPLSSSNSAITTLSQRPPSGAQQVSNKRDKFNSTWPVKFIYQEAVWAARSVFLRIDQSNSKYPQQDIQLERNDSGAFETVVNLHRGTIQYRFRVIPTENTQVDVAPYTRLGWDDSAAKNTSELITWPLDLVLHDNGNIVGDIVSKNISKNRISTMNGIEENRNQIRNKAVQVHASEALHTQPHNRNIKYHLNHRRWGLLAMGLLAGAFSMTMVKCLGNTSEETDEDDKLTDIFIHDEKIGSNKLSVFEYTKGISL